MVSKEKLSPWRRTVGVITIGALGFMAAGCGTEKKPDKNLRVYTAEDLCKETLPQFESVSGRDYKFWRANTRGFIPPKKVVYNQDYPALEVRCRAKATESSDILEYSWLLGRSTLKLEQEPEKPDYFPAYVLDSNKDEFKFSLWKRHGFISGFPPGTYYETTPKWNIAVTNPTQELCDSGVLYTDTSISFSSRAREFRCHAGPYYNK